MSIYTKAVDMPINLTLTLRYDTITVESYQPDSGDRYRLVFRRDENPEEIAARIGEEIASWLPLMEDIYNDMEE